MRRPSALPLQLHGQTFTRAEAAALGVRDARLTARDITRLGRATYLHTPLVPGQPSLNRPVGDAREDLIRALCRRAPNAWVSHLTAAELYGLPLPRRFADDRGIHLTGPHRSHYSRRDPEVVLHRSEEVPEDLLTLRGLRLSSPPRLFCELGAQLNLIEHIVIGDQLVRQPHAGLEPRREPLTTLARLDEAVSLHRGRVGAPQAREALAAVRVGSDSPPETLLRLALIRAGLPEPELQLPLDPADPFAPVADAGYRWARVVIQYDGAHHFHPEQQASDQRRNAQFEREDWTVVIANRVDLREHFTRIVGRVGQLLARASR